MNIFPAREIHHTYTKYIYFIMAKVVNTNVLKKYIICASIYSKINCRNYEEKYFLMISFFFYFIYISFLVIYFFTMYVRLVSLLLYYLSLQCKNNCKHNNNNSICFNFSITKKFFIVGLNLIRGYIILYAARRVMMHFQSGPQDYWSWPPLA